MTKMELAHIEKWRIERLCAAIRELAPDEKRPEGNKTAFGKMLGHKDGGHVRQMISGARPITEKTIRQIEEFPGMAGWFDEKVSSHIKPVLPNRQSGPPDNQSSSVGAYNVPRIPDRHIPVGDLPAKRIYVVGQANGGLPERLWTDGGYLVGATEEFAVLATDDPHAFLCPIIGTSMAPVYNPGDFAFVEPGTEVELGDDVLVRLTAGGTMLKQLRSLRNGVQLGSYNEPGTLFFKPEEIAWMYYVAHPVRRKKIKTRF
jgi:phage repressor protein C with HTH and peptisase S24 domain